MSFVYNQKEVFHGCSTKSVDFTLSSKLAIFYLNNSNPNRQDLEQFCKEADFDFNSAVSYIKERKMQDIRNRNLVFMKFGREYIQPSSEQVKEYENSLVIQENSESSSSTAAFGAAENHNTFKKLTNKKSKSDESQKDYLNSDLLLDEIPKKTQSSINNNKSNNTNTNNLQSNFENDSTNIKINKKQSSFSSSSPTKSIEESKGKSAKLSSNTYNNSDTDALTSSASLGRLFNNYYQHSFLPSGIFDTKLIHSLILFMKKDLKLELKHEVSITLARTSNNLVLQRFLEFQGAEILSNWLHEIKEKIQDLPNSSATASQNYLNNILLNLLIFCEKLKISLKDLKFSKIGKEVNKLAKLNLDNKEIHAKCVALVHKWKKIVEETKEGKKTEGLSSVSVSGLNNSAEKSEEEKNEKADLTQSLLKGILSEEAACVKKKELDPENFELLNRKKLHPDKEKEKEKDRDRDRESSGFSAHDKNNKKFKREESNFDFENQNRKEREIQQQPLAPAFDNRNLINNKNLNPNQPIPSNFIYNTIPLGAPIQNPVQAAYNQKKGALKGILKTSQSSNQPSTALKKDIKKANIDKKRIKFEHDMMLEKVKIFKLTDEVNAPNLTEEEYQKIQQELLKDPTRSFLGDMKFRESHMEKENLLREKEKAKIAKEMFEKMTPEIKINRPLEIYIESFYEEGEEIEKELVSEEKEQIDQFLNKILMTTYFREIDIPPTPKMGKSEMFEFFDENIPKIENLKKSFDSEKPIYEVDFSKIEHIESNPELLKSIAERINNAELSIQSEEEKNKLLAILQNQMKKTEESNKLGNNNTLAPLLNQLPNLMPNNNNNNLNQMNPLAAANMLNNMKMNPINMGNQIPQNIPNQMFPAIQPMGMGTIPMVPQFNQMNNMMNPNNMMNMNNMNLMKNNLNFPNNHNLNLPMGNMPSSNPNMMGNPMMNKNLLNNMNMNMNSGFNNGNHNNNNMMNSGVGNKMNMGGNYNSNNPNFSHDNRTNFKNQDNRPINFSKIKTKPCRGYHGPVGCPRTDDCYFIHDPENQGRDIPEARLAELAKANTENANNNNNINFNNNNQNNSFYNNNVQNNRFRNYRNINNRNNNNNNNFSNNRFQQNQQGNNNNNNNNNSNNNFDGNGGNNFAKEENWNSNRNTNFTAASENNINNNVNLNINNESQGQTEGNSNGFSFNQQDEMEIDSKENFANESNKNNDAIENEAGFDADGNSDNNANSNSNKNNNSNNNINNDGYNQNNFYNNNNANLTNNNNNFYNRHNGNNMHHRNFHHRHNNGSRLNNYNKNMNYHNNNHNNNNFSAQPNFNQQQQYHNMIQQNKPNGNMPFNDNNLIIRNDMNSGNN